MSTRINNSTCRRNTGKPMSKVAPLCIQGYPPVPRAIPSVAGIRGCSLLRAPGLGPPPCTQDCTKLPPRYRNQAASSVSKTMTYQDCALPLRQGYAPPARAVPSLCTQDCATCPLCTRAAHPLPAENCLLCGCLLPTHMCLPGHLLPGVAPPPRETNAGYFPPSPQKGERTRVSVNAYMR